MLPPHLGLHHVALRVDDVAQASRFFVDVLGYTLEWAPDADAHYLTQGSDNVALHRRQGPARAPGDAAQDALDHVGILLPGAQAVALWQAHLVGHGAALLAAARQHRDGATSCTVRVPGGVVLQMLHHPPLTRALSAAQDCAAAAPTGPLF